MVILRYRILQNVFNFLKVDTVVGSTVQLTVKSILQLISFYSTCSVFQKHDSLPISSTM